MEFTFGELLNSYKYSQTELISCLKKLISLILLLKKPFYHVFCVT